MLVCDADEAADAMRSVAENLIRASMSSVDIWRAIERLEAQGWNEQAIGDALALPVRTVRRLKLLAHLHPAMLDVMALGSMPNEDQLRTIAAATREEQAQVWKKHKPKKGHTDVAWYEVARALAKRRMPFAAAKFGDDLAKAYGIVWEDDLFAPPGEDSRYTTNVEGFFGAQQEWLQNNLPERGTLVPVDEYGSCQLPKKAERVYGKPGKGDLVGHYIDARTGEAQTVVYRLPERKKATRPADGTNATSDVAGNEDDGDAPTAKARPDVTQKGVAMIGDLRTDALHQALADMPIEDDTLFGLLILAFGGDNVTIESGSDQRGADRRAICRTITEGGVLTADRDLLRRAAREMLIGVLSCRENRSKQRVLRPDRGRGDRRLAPAAEHGDGRVPVVPVARRARDRRQGGGRQHRPAREGHAGAHDHALQGRHIRLSRSAFRADIGGARRRGAPGRNRLGQPGDQ